MPRWLRFEFLSPPIIPFSVLENNVFFFFFVIYLNL